MIISCFLAFYSLQSYANSSAILYDNIFSYSIPFLYMQLNVYIFIISREGIKSQSVYFFSLFWWRDFPSQPFLRCNRKLEKISTKERKSPLSGLALEQVPPLQDLTFYFFVLCNGQSFLALLFWVTGIHLLLLFCIPESSDSELKSTIGWCYRAIPGLGRIPNILLGSTQMIKQQLAQPLSMRLRAGVSCSYPLPSLVFQGTLEG